ncbi:unnamed protein product [Dimorphilus gyrociliatus]|uniref:Uncharacterized protein n=1 Tax=Dimorphilus gyrociliatus TaxID=2664684 RepID=A0A7I8V828_9ANNE|nr:unnamed protein product [Dimorphilus gyrociliatus]
MVSGKGVCNCFVFFIYLITAIQISVITSLPITPLACGNDTFCKITDYCNRENIPTCLPCEIVCRDPTPLCFNLCPHVGWFAQGKTQNEIVKIVDQLVGLKVKNTKTNNNAIVHGKATLVVSGIVGGIFILLLIGIGLAVYGIIKYLKKKKKEKRATSTGVFADGNECDKGQRQPCL